MSLGEIQEVYDLLIRINDILSDIETKTQNVEREGPRALTRVNNEGRATLGTFRQLERVAIRYLAIAKRMGLPDDVDNTIQKLARLLVVVRMLQMSLTMIMAGGPLNILSGVAGFAMASISVVEGY